MIVCQLAVTDGDSLVRTDQSQRGSHSGKYSRHTVTTAEGYDKHSGEYKH